MMMDDDGLTVAWHYSLCCIVACCSAVCDSYDSVLNSKLQHTLPCTPVIWHKAELSDRV